MPSRKSNISAAWVDVFTLVQRGSRRLPDTLDPAGRKMDLLLQCRSGNTSDRALKGGSTRRNKHITLPKI